MELEERDARQYAAVKRLSDELNSKICVAIFFSEDRAEPDLEVAAYAGTRALENQVSLFQAAMCKAATDYLTDEPRCLIPQILARMAKGGAMEFKIEEEVKPGRVLLRMQDGVDGVVRIFAKEDGSTSRQLAPLIARFDPQKSGLIVELSSLGQLGIKLYVQDSYSSEPRAVPFLEQREPAHEPAGPDQG